ncbi:hypothetical protein OsI_11316 [Oryza sativa Indica Group]|uniref:Uncharacterized protein n=1 Tax=Oryza sativa subsp. indica TaxID=39946 RepID=B8AMZ7_ORYSI|nr:hypothetical protein OsI_11316 [Oryza sativa Indica Group]
MPPVTADTVTTTAAAAAECPTTSLSPSLPRPDSFPATNVATASTVMAAVAAATDANHRLRKPPLRRRPPPATNTVAVNFRNRRRRCQLPPATLQIWPRGTDLGDTAAITAGHRAIAATSRHGTTAAAFAPSTDSVPAAIAIPAAFSHRRPTPRAPTFAVALPAASRRPARSGRSGPDLAVTAAAPRAAPLPARCEVGERPRHRRPCGRLALPAAAQKGLRIDPTLNPRGLWVPRRSELHLALPFFALPVVRWHRANGKKTVVAIEKTNGPRADPVVSLTNLLSDPLSGLAEPTNSVGWLWL